MLQTIAGKLVYVVEFDTMPAMPITGLTAEEAQYDKAIEQVGGNINRVLFGATNSMTYAQVLTLAIETGVIAEPGKYGLHKDHKNSRWEAFKIVEGE